MSMQFCCLLNSVVDEKVFEVWADAETALYKGLKA